MRLPRLLAGAGWAVLLGLLHSVGVAQGRLQAGPTLLEISPRSTTTHLTLRNTGNAPIAAQVRVYEWSQDGGKDVLVPSESLVVSPPITEITAGTEQIVRVIRFGPPADVGDQTYRIVIDELPWREDSGGGVSLRMRYVLPLFVRAANADAPALSCAMDTVLAQLSCWNDGGQAAQLGASRLIDEHGRILVLSEGLLGYVLPGSRRHWRFPDVSSDSWSRAAPRLETHLNGRPMTLNVDHDR